MEGEVVEQRCAALTDRVARENSKVLARCSTRSQNSQPLNNAVVELGRRRKRAVGRGPLVEADVARVRCNGMVEDDSGGRQRCKPFEWRMSSATYGGSVQDPESLTGGPP